MEFELHIILVESNYASDFHDLESSSIIWKGVLFIGKSEIFLVYARYNVFNEKGGLDMNFMEKFNELANRTLVPIADKLAN